MHLVTAGIERETGRKADAAEGQPHNLAQTPDFIGACGVPVFPLKLCAKRDSFEKVGMPMKFGASYRMVEYSELPTALPLEIDPAYALDAADLKTKGIFL